MDGIMFNKEKYSLKPHYNAHKAHLELLNSLTALNFMIVKDMVYRKHPPKALLKVPLPRF